MIEKLIKINDIYKKNASGEEKRKRILIDKILKENNAFAKIDVETAFSILKDLNIEDDKLDEVYVNIINEENI